MPTRNRAWSSTMRIRRPLAVGRADRVRPAGAPVRRIAHQLVSSAATGIASRTSGAAVGPGLHFEAGADQLRALSHELQAEVPAATGGDGSDVEPAAVVADLEDPVVAVDSRWRP